MPPASGEMSSSHPKRLFRFTFHAARCEDRFGINYAFSRIVVFRIEILTEAQTIVHIDGRLTESSVCELLKVCRGVPQPPILDLSQLSSASTEAVEALRELVAEGARLRGTPRYIELLLNDARETGNEA